MNMKVEIKLKYTLEKKRKTHVNKIINFSYLIYYSHERTTKITFKIKM